MSVIHSLQNPLSLAGYTGISGVSCLYLYMYELIIATRGVRCGIALDDCYHQGSGRYTAWRNAGLAALLEQQGEKPGQQMNPFGEN